RIAHTVLPRGLHGFAVVVVNLGRGLPPLFFNDTATTEISTLSLHDALPIFANMHPRHLPPRDFLKTIVVQIPGWLERSGAYTSELQSPRHLRSRLLPGT